MKVDTIKNISVVGAGIMGHGIAQAFLMGGYSVKLYDIQNSILDTARSHIQEGLRLFCDAGLIKEGDMGPALEALTLTTDLKKAVKGADYVEDSKIRIPLKGDLLLNINEYDEIADANLILYGKDTDGARKYVQLNHSDSDQLLGADDEIWYAGDMAFVGIWGNAPFDFEIFLFFEAYIFINSLKNQEGKGM